MAACVALFSNTPTVAPCLEVPRVCVCVQAVIGHANAAFRGLGGGDNTELVFRRLAPTGVPWRVPAPDWPDTLCRQQPNYTHTHTHTQQDQRQHMPLRNTTAEQLCYDISNQERRQTAGFARPKGAMEERERGKG